MIITHLVTIHHNLEDCNTFIQYLIKCPLSRRSDPKKIKKNKGVGPIIDPHEIIYLIEIDPLYINKFKDYVTEHTGVNSVVVEMMSEY